MKISTDRLATFFLVDDPACVPMKITENKPFAVFVYLDRIELAVFEWPENLSYPRISLKKFDYKDLILMNNTLNAIWKPKNEKN